MARLMLSAGMFSALAACTAVRRRGFFSASPPDLAAIVISLIRRVNILPRLASSAPFLCLIVAHLEWPDIERPRMQRQTPHYSRAETPFSPPTIEHTEVSPSKCRMQKPPRGSDFAFFISHFE